MKIQNREVDFDRDYLSPVTYVPRHAFGNASHPDCEQGVIVSQRGDSIGVLYCKSRTVQVTQPEDLVWG